MPDPRETSCARPVPEHATNLKGLIDATLERVHAQAYAQGVKDGRQKANALAQGLHELCAKLNNEPLTGPNERLKVADELWELLSAFERIGPATVPAGEAAGDMNSDEARKLAAAVRGGPQPG